MNPPKEQELQLRKIIERENKNLLKHHELKPGSTRMAEKREPGSEGRAINTLSTNVYGLFSDEKIRVHRYDVTITVASHRDIELTGPVSNDSRVLDRRSMCRDAMEAFAAQESTDFFRFNDSNQLYYDLQKILYSLLELNVPQGPVGQAFDVQPLPQNFQNFQRLTVKLKTTTETFPLTLADLHRTNRDLETMDLALEQFLNIATAQAIFFERRDDFITFSAGRGYILHPEDHGFEPNRDAPVFPDGRLMLGYDKSVRLIEGLDKQGVTALIIESKKTAFHLPEMIVAKAMRVVRDISHTQNGDLLKLNTALKKLRVETTHRPHQFIIRNIGEKSALEQTIEYQGEDTSIAEYFRKRYGIVLRYPNAKLIETRGLGGSGTSYYPMELCKILPHQRIKGPQMGGILTQQMIKHCAIPPATLRPNIDKTMMALGLDNNTYLKSITTDFCDENLKVPARLLSAPSMLFGSNQVARVNERNYTWNGNNFVAPMDIGRQWMAFCFNGTYTGRGLADVLDHNEFGDFIQRFVTEGRRRGMRMDMPADIRMVNECSPKGVIKEIESAKKAGFKLVFCCHSNSADDIHHVMKYAERCFDIITQGVQMNTVRNVISKNQHQTLGNMVMKTNCKLGGINYCLANTSTISREIQDRDTLFIGIATNHPAGGLGGFDIESKKKKASDSSSSGNGNGNGNGAAYSSETSSSSGNGNGNGYIENVLLQTPPSVVGFAANMTEYPFAFIGDFRFQEIRRDEKTGIILDIVSCCVKRYRQNRGKDPKRLIVYRNGCSEGSYAMVLKYEVPLMKNALKKLRCKANLTLIATNKLSQGVRFIPTEIDPRAKAPEQNIQPGTVVDTHCTSLNYAEWFLCSHRALQGTARVPRYSVLFDDNGMTMDALEGITHNLCFGHQVVFSPTSLPSPVYIAEEYAKRGRNLYNVHVDAMLSHARATGNTSVFVNVGTRELQHDLSFGGVENLANKRVNA